MPAAKNGDHVRVHYTGKFSDGEVFDSSREGEPIHFTLGTDDVIPGFDAAVCGMNIGDRKTVTIPATDAYGPIRDDMFLDVPREDIPSDVKLEVGDAYQLKNDLGEELHVVIAEIYDDAVTLDANHPLAGVDLTFELELVAIEG